MSDALIWTILHPPDEIISETIRKALNEDEEKLENNVKLLEEWISCQNHLPKNYDKRLLYGYIRGAKHVLEDAKRKIETYFISRTIHQDLFGNRILTLEHDLEATTFMYSATLPDLTPEGYRITIEKVFNTNIDVFNPLKMLRLAALFGELRTHEENFTAGEILILDCEKLPAAIGAKTAPHLKEFVVMQDSFPVLVKQVHIITDKPVFVNIANALKVFLKEKIKNRIHFHKSSATISKFIPPKYLPKDYGGEQGSLEEINTKWQQVLPSYAPLFKKIDEVKLIGPIPKQKNENNEDFGAGLEGSFRKLNID